MPDPTGTESFPEHTRVTRENSDRSALKLLAVAENIGHLHVFNLAVEVMFPSRPLSVDAPTLAFLPRIWLGKLRNIQIGNNSRDCVRMRGPNQLCGLLESGFLASAAAFSLLR